MNTRQVISTAAAAISLLGAQSQAASVNAPLNVTIALTAACTVTAPTAMSFAYTAMTNSPVTATGGTGGTITCTDQLPFTMFLGDLEGGQVSTAAKDFTDPATNLTYRLTLNSAASPGTGAAQSYSVEGFIGAAQTGKCATATCTPTIAHTVYVNY